MPAIILMGVSGAGKDTAADILQKLLPDTERPKISAPMKRMYEQHYRLPYRSLDDRVFRLQPVPDALGRITPDSPTYLDLMVRSCDYLTAIDTDIMLRQFVPEFRAWAAYNGQYSILTDVRRPREVEVLLELESKCRPYFIVHIHGRGKGLESDRHLVQNLAALRSDDDLFWSVDNSGSEEDLRHQLTTLAEYVRSICEVTAGTPF